MHVTKGLLLGLVIMSMVVAIDLIVARGVLFAQQAITAAPGGQLPFDIGNLTATAILGWYAYYTATTVLPRLVKDFRDEVAAERVAHNERLARLHDEHRADREAFLESSRRLTNTKGNG